VRTLGIPERAANPGWEILGGPRQLRPAEHLRAGIGRLRRAAENPNQDPLTALGLLSFLIVVAMAAKRLDRPTTRRKTLRVRDRKYNFDIDEQGRTWRAEGDLANPDRVIRERDPASQRELSGGLGGDPQAGHLIGNQFGAPGTRENLVLMSRDLNLSGWKRMENELAELARRKRVRVVVTVHYQGQNKMPSRFTVDATTINPEGAVVRRRWRFTQAPKF
jgi:hypothetical protein